MEICYIVYKTTNLINGKFYIGVHRLGSSRKYYLGSGIYLQKAIKKYGKGNFYRETIREFSSKREAYDFEKQLVTEAFIKTNQCYNLALGGYGGDLGEVSNSKKRGKLNWMVTASKERKPSYGRTGKKHPLFGKKYKDFTTENGRKIASEKLKNSKIGSKNPASRKVIDTLTGKVFDTIKDAAASINMNSSTLAAWLSGRLTNRSSMKILGET